MTVSRPTPLPHALTTLAILFGFLGIGATADAAAVTVNDGGDSLNACATTGTGTCTLRDAITYANAHAGSTIAFNIPGSGVHTISPASSLPAISAAVMIDGSTQPGSSPNTLAVGDNAVLNIQLSGPGLTGVGLDVATSNVTIRGLVINGFNGCVRFISGVAANNTVAGNFIGVDPTGMTAVTTGAGVLIIGQSNNTIGGTSPADRNLISGCNPAGIDMGGSGNVVQGNYIGTNAPGTAALPNIQAISILSPNTQIGGSATGAGNLVSGNNEGILIVADGTVVEGNLIGTDASGNAPLANLIYPVYVGGNATVVGGTAAGAGNLIAFNSNPGVIVGGGTDNTIRGNSIHDNVTLGIDLGNDGVTPNDLGDGDTGPNNLQNFPVISSVVYGASSTTVTGLLNSTASTTFDIDFYSNPACSNFPREFLQGETYLGSAQVTTDASCNGPFTVSTLPSVPSGSRISVTATDPSGNTSEFSQRLPFSINVASGSPSGGTAITISGTNFLSGATVTIGGTAATGVGVTNYTTMTAATPALAPGSANDLVVSNTDGTNGTLVKAFVADFLDVPNSNQFYSFVTKLVSNAITAGIGGGLYGVVDNTLRQQMAVFLLKGKHGLCYTPPACTPGFFTDVPCPSTFANWIQAMATEGITGGCGGGAFCPQNPVRRDQMAVFLLKAEHGSSYVPPACTPPGVFLDVPCPGTFTNWIDQLATENITGGCGGGNYCPSSANTRGQMAVFITKTFNLQ
jgi:hypothetical protein